MIYVLGAPNASGLMCSSVHDAGALKCPTALGAQVAGLLLVPDI